MPAIRGSLAGCLCALVACLAGCGGGEAAMPRGTGGSLWSAGDCPPELRAQRYLTIEGVAGQNGHTRRNSDTLRASDAAWDFFESVSARHKRALQTR